MKSLLLLPVLALPLLLGGCEAVVVDRPYHRTAYVERDVVVDRHHHRPYYDNDYRYDRYDRYHRRPYVERDVVVTNTRPHRDVVVVNPRPAYKPRVEVRYYNDARGRYYIKDGRRIYSNAGVYY